MIGLNMIRNRYRVANFIEELKEEIENKIYSGDVAICS